MHSSIRVTMLIQGYYPRVGGAERQLAALIPLLQERGCEVQVLTRRYPGLAPFKIICGVPVYRLPIPGSKPVASSTFTLTALSLLRRLKPQVIHAHELLSPATTAVMAKRLFGMPVVAKVLRGGRLGDLAKLRHKPLGRLRMATLRRHVDAFITISQEIDTELAEVGIPQCRRWFIPNGVDTKRFIPLSLEQKRAQRTLLGLPDVPIVIYTGRLAAEKRLDQLIAIWPEIRRVYREALLLVLGAGEEEDALRRTAGAGIRFAGLVENVVPYLQAADLFMLPSATEGLSNALLEALATGLPSIATAVGGAPDVIDHGNSGWLVSPDKPLLLRDSILTLLGNANLRARLGCQGRERIQRCYALSVTAQHLCSLYDQVLSNR